MKATYILLLVALLVSSNIYAKGSKLSVDQIKSVFANKKFLGRNMDSGNDFELTTTAGGRNTIVVGFIINPKTISFKWWINSKAQRCTNHPKFGNQCYDIIDMGNGVYHQVQNGKHTHTLKVK